jgi:hypothetical protein
MRNSGFNSLTIPQQAELLLQEGFFLHTREEPGFFVHGQYIEIYFHRKQEDFVVIKTFYSSENGQIPINGQADILYPLPFSWRNIAC